MPPKVWGSTPANSNSNNSGGLSRAPPPPPHQKQQKKDDDKGWTKSSTLQQDQDKLTRKSLDFANTAAKVATSVDEAATNLKKFIIKTVHDNNHLGLPDEEINNMAKLLMQTPNKNEIYQWAETLMQPKSFAEDIIKQRDIAAQQFASKGKDQRQNASDDDDDDGSATTASGYSVATTSASTATSRRKEGKGTRGKVVNLGKKGGDADRGVLVEGAQFECGCFGTSHDFRSNCANCGRIFCMQESDEVCYSCQLPPQSCLALDLRQALGKISDASDRKDREGLEVALNRRDQLLQFAKERSKRTQIIDDQSGMHGKLDPWSSRAERAKASVAEEEERKKIAELHKRTGAVTVHLDIVNEAISLGATAISKKDDAESMKESAVEMGLGFGDDSEEKKKNAAMTEDESQQKRRAEEAAVCAGISHQKKNTFTTTKTTSAAPINLQKLGKNNNQQEEENQDDDENNDDEISKDEINYGEEEMIDDDGTRRVIALPSLMQQIFYCNSEEEAAEKTKIKASLKQSQNTGSLYVGGSKQRNNASNKNDDQQQSQSHHRRAVDFRRADDRKTGNSTGVTLKESNEKLSRRVQVDYFEGDNDTWLMAEQQDELLESKDEEENTNNKNKRNRFAQQQDARLGERFIDQARLMNVTTEDAKDWKDSDAKKEMGGGFNNNNNNNDDEESIPRQQLSSSSSAAGGLFFQLQQQARKLIHKDEGWCLSMHQPWASLLIAGIKTHEGRTWPTEWRGRLWIHAAAAKPTQETIDEVEAHARQFVPEGTKFPTSYPTKCLLGCAAMVDCLDRERYETVFPTPDQQQLSESSTHCFLCLSPKVLPFPLAMDGNHKLYKLDKKHWQAARKLFKETV